MYVYKGLQGFVAELTAPLLETDVTPVMRLDKAARLCANLASGGHTYLVVQSPVSYEIVKASCSFNTIVLERGQDGTMAQPHPMGACMLHQLVGAAVTELAELADACPEGCTQATILSGNTLPDGVAGVAYEHRIVISGTPPFSLGMVTAPAWLSVVLDAGEIRLSGIPDAAGAYNVDIPLRSCGVLEPFFSGCILVTAEP
jgi:hypothetical protein